MVLDLASAEALRKITTPIPAPADAAVYTLRRGSANAIRTALRNSMNDKHLLTVGGQFFNFPVSTGGSAMGFDSNVFYALQRPDGMYRFSVSSYDPQAVTLRAENDALQMQLKIDHKEAVLTRARVQKDQESTELRKTANIQWAGPIPLGRSHRSSLSAIWGPGRASD